MCTAACVGIASEQLLNMPEATESIEVATIDEIPVGQSKIFHYPSKHQPCILIHLEEGYYVAFSQSCTHLMCPVHYQEKKRELVCPCHNGYFNAENGEVLAGPPPRPLPRYEVNIVEQKIVVGPKRLDV